MKITDKERLKTRSDIVKEANDIANIYDRILAIIRKAPSEKKALQGFKKLKQTMEICERQIFLSLGKLN